MQTTHAHPRPSRPATRSQIGILLQSHHTGVTTANLTPTGAESQGPPHGVAWAAGEMTGRCSNLLTSSYKHPHPPKKHKRNSRHLGFSWFQSMRIGFLYKATWHPSIFPFFPEKEPGGKQEGWAVSDLPFGLRVNASAPPQLQGPWQPGSWVSIPHSRRSNGLLSEGRLERTPWDSTSRRVLASKRPHPPCGGYLGTGQSGKHLIATLRRGDVRNKGGCADSWELPFPGNSGSHTKP